MLQVLDKVLAQNGKFKKDTRVWVDDRYGLRAGKVLMVGAWLSDRKGEEPTIFIHVQYDEPNKFGKTDEYFWRQHELRVLHVQEFYSNCCSAPIAMHDDKGHGKCLKCFENCTPIEPGILVDPPHVEHDLPF